jgi:AraC-like DNA-binding protein
MNALIHTPDNELKEVVECIWYQSEEQWEYASVSIPFLQQEIIINFGEEFSIQTGNSAFSYTKAGGVSGIYQQQLTTKVSGRYKALGIMFKPQGLHRLLGIDISGLGVPRPLYHIFGAAIGSVITEIEHTKNATDKIKHLERFLLKAAQPAKTAEDVLEFAEITTHEPLQKGRIKHYLGDKRFSHKKFINAFSSAYGLSPQKYLRLKQVNEAIAQIANQPHIALVDVALDNGFYDQAHFIRTFKAFTTITPLAYKKAVLEGRVHRSFPNTITL